MDSFKQNFSRRPNLFDDPQISTEQVEKYRSAQTINALQVNPLQKIIEKLKENPFQSSLSSIPTPLTLLKNIKCFPIGDSISLNPVMETLKEDEKIVEFSLTAFHPKDSNGQKVPLDFSLRDQMTSNMLDTLCRKGPVYEMEVSMGDCLINSELINAWGNNVNAKPEEKAEKKLMEPISFDNIELTTSFMVPYNRPGAPSDQTEEKNCSETSEDIQEQTQTSIRTSTMTSNRTSNMTRTERTEDKEESYEEVEESEESEDSEDTDSHAGEEREVTESQNVAVTDSWRSSTVVEKADKSMCTEKCTFEGGLESIPPIRILVDQVVDTMDLLPEKIEEEKPETEDKGTDTKYLIISKDQLTDTNELVEDEQRKAQAQIASLKLGFLAQLDGLKGQITSLKEDQGKNKKSVQGQLTGTIDQLTQMVRSSFNNYIEERKGKQMKDFMAHKKELEKTKEELSKLRSFVVFSTEKIKEAIANYIQGEGKQQIQKLIEDSAKERLFQFGLNKLNEYLVDNHSISTESSHATPLRIDTPTKETPSKAGAAPAEKKTRGRKPKKMDKAVLEGMRYLLGHEGFEKDYKDKIENLLKPQASGELTSELVLNSLMGRGKRRKAGVSTSLNAKEGSVELLGKRMRLEGSSIRDDESIISQNLTAFEVESVTSERLEFSTPVKGGERKKVKRQYRHPDFMENNGDKVVLISRDVNLDKVE